MAEFIYLKIKTHRLDFGLQRIECHVPQVIFFDHFVNVTFLVTFLLYSRPSLRSRNP